MPVPVDLEERELAVIQQLLDGFCRSGGLEAAEAAATINGKLVRAAQAAGRAALVAEIRAEIAAEAAAKAETASDATRRPKASK